jgi:pimeloyl-ACP methyl ester carboxylesterase
MNYRLNEKIFGGGESRILLLHGCMHSGRIFERLAERLSRYYSVHVIDLPLFDISEEEANITSISTLSQYVLEYLKQSDFDLIFAHSMGAAIIVRIIMHGYLKKKKIILCSPAYGGIRILSGLRLTVGIIEKCLGLILRHNKFLRFFVRRTYCGESEFENIILADAKRVNVKAASRLIFELAFVKEFIVTADMGENVISIFYGDKDRLLYRERVEELSELLGAELKIFYNIGHTPFIENASDVIEYINRMQNTLCDSLCVEG